MLVSAWSHLTRVVVKQYRNGVAVRLLISPRPNVPTATAATVASATDDSNLLQQEISFLIHTNLINDLMAFIEGYSQVESSNVSLSIEHLSYLTKSATSPTLHRSKVQPSSDDNQPPESTCRSPLVQRILHNKKNHRTYRIKHDKPSPPASPSLLDLTRQFFTRAPAKTMDVHERETISNVPNRTTLVTWRSLADAQTTITTSIPPPVLYRTVINVKPTGSGDRSLPCLSLAFSVSSRGTDGIDQQRR